MTELEEMPPFKPTFENIFLRKKYIAFLSTSMAVFFALSIIGSLTVSRFQTRSYLELTSTAEIDGKFFQQLIDLELEDQQLTKHIEAASRNSLLIENRHIANQELERIREQVSFQTSRRKNGNQYRVAAVFSGLGSEGEKNLTRSLVRGLSRRIASKNNVEEALARVQHQFIEVKNSIEQNATRLQAELSVASRLVDELNLDLSNAYRTVESLGTELRPDGSNVAFEELDKSSVNELLGALKNKLSQIETTENDQDLYNLGQAVAQINKDLQELGLSDSANKSMRIINASLPQTNSAVRSILDILAKCDTDSLQTQIGRAQNNLKVDAIQLREDVTAANLLAEQIPESRYIVNSVSDGPTLPEENSPGVGYMLLIGLFSIGFGSVISMYYRPEFEEVGFESVENTQEILGVPVIARIEESDEVAEEPNTVANSVVRYSEVALFGFFVLTLLLCFAQPDLRQAFLDSPIYGLSRMAGMFFG